MLSIPKTRSWTTTGGALPLKTRRNGWLDIEYGDPGMQKQPVLHWNGTRYE